MTALTQYQRLEALGLWQPPGKAAPREVVVSFGQATLVLSDPATEVPLTHWSLPAVTNLTPGQHPAIYAPGPPADGDTPPDETLTLSEPDMIDALARVHQAIDAALPHPGRLRRRLSWGLAALAIAAGVWFLPGQIIHHAAGIAPQAQRILVAEAVVADLTRITGPVCRRAAGDTVLTRLAERLAPAAGGDVRLRLQVLPGGIQGAHALPGGVVLIGPDLLGVEGEPVTLPPEEPDPDAGAEDAAEDWSALTSTRPVPRPAGRTAPPSPATPPPLASPGPDILAGEILAALQQAEEAEPLPAILAHAGAWSSLSLLMQGRISPDAVHGYARGLVGTAAPLPQDAEALLARFAAIALPAAPYARRLGHDLPLALALMEGDPVRGQPTPRAILSESEWQALQEICRPR